jgi:hypothetical protein
LPVTLATLVNGRVVFDTGLFGEADGPAG